MKILILIVMVFPYITYGQVNFDQTYDTDEVQHIIIDNFKGDINVSAGNSEIINIKATNIELNADSKMNLKEHRDGNVVAVYLDNPCKAGFTKFDPKNPFKFIRTEDGCEWGEFDMEKFPNLTFDIEIPTNMNIYISTIMEGDVKVVGIDGIVYASNVNGNIKLDRVSKVKNGTTVNGDVDITYSKVPTLESRFTTINGEININLPLKSSVKTKFKSFNGELFTDFDAVTLENKVNPSSITSGEMLKIQEYSEAKIGTGEVTFVIETFNNDAFLRKIKNN